MKSIIVLFFGIIILCLDLYGIQKPAWQGKIEYENGVEVIKNPNEPQYGEITLELVEDLLIEDKDGKDYFFQWLCDIDVDSDGNIYVLDRQQHKAYIFDRFGNCIKAIGGKGQGPGEFNTPKKIVIDGEDRINVLENRRLHLSSLDKNNSVYGNSSEYRLYIIDSLGSKVRIIERDESQKRELYFARLFTNEDGLIFVNRSEKGEPSSLDIFNIKGHYIYKAYTNGTNTRTIRAGYLYTLESDSDTGAQFVKRYKINNWDQIKVGI